MKLDYSVHFSVMGIVAKTKQHKTKTLQDEVRKIPSDDIELISGVWMGFGCMPNGCLHSRNVFCQYKLLF